MGFTYIWCRLIIVPIFTIISLITHRPLLSLGKKYLCPSPSSCKCDVSNEIRHLTISSSTPQNFSFTALCKLVKRDFSVLSAPSPHSQRFCISHLHNWTLENVYWTFLLIFRLCYGNLSRDQHKNFEWWRYHALIVMMNWLFPLLDW